MLTLDGLSLGDGYTLEPGFSPRSLDYTSQISAASAPTVQITATPHDPYASIAFYNGSTWSYSTDAGARTWSFSGLPADGGTSNLKVRVSKGNDDQDYTLALVFTKTGG